VPEPERVIDDLVGTVNRAIHWMQHALDQQVQQRRATQEFAAAEMERMTQVLHLLEDLRHGAAAAPRPDLQVSFAASRGGSRRP
jgi:hypothetical protein